MRSKLVRSHVDEAESAALEGRMEKATEELRKALQIDPGNTMVAERLTQMNSMEDEPPSTSAAENDRLAKVADRRVENRIWICEEKPGRSMRNLRAIRNKSLVRSGCDRPARCGCGWKNVDFYTALMLLGTQTGTFWRALNPDADFRDARIVPRNAKSTARSAAGISFAGSGGAGRNDRIVARAAGHYRRYPHRTGYPKPHHHHARHAGKIGGGGTADSRSGESARRSFAGYRTAGSGPRAPCGNWASLRHRPTSLILLTPKIVRHVGGSTDLANLLTNAQQVFNGQGFSSIPPFVLLGGGLSTFLLTLPGASVDFSDSLSLVRSGREVLLRAQDNKPATFFVGDRYRLHCRCCRTVWAPAELSRGTPSGATFPETNFAGGQQSHRSGGRAFYRRNVAGLGGGFRYCAGQIRLPCCRIRITGTLCRWARRRSLLALMKPAKSRSVREFFVPTAQNLRLRNRTT